MTALPPTYYLHVWWARRPLVASRAAVLASLLPADADREQFLHVLGIHGDPVAARSAIDRARRTGIRVENPYGYDRAFSYRLTDDDGTWLKATLSDSLDSFTVLDPTAGGGSIPFETIRLGLEATGQRSESCRGSDHEGHSRMAVACSHSVGVKPIRTNWPPSGASGSRSASVNSPPNEGLPDSS